MKTAFCFDLDGTLTEEEILPEIAKSLGIYEEIDTLTKITMQGLMTFDKSMKLRVKLLSTVPISEVVSIVKRIKINSDLQSFILENPENCFIVTGNLDVWINDFIHEKYKCNFFSSKADFEDNQLIGINHILQKSEAINNIRNNFDRVISVGDGMNDCSMFEKSNFSIAYGGVHEPVPSLMKLSNYVCYDSKSLLNLLNSLNNHYED